MTLHEKLRQRFVDAIRKCYQPCPLIGERWFALHENATPPYFQFSGTGKLAKALGSHPSSVARKVAAALDLSDLDGEVSVADDGKINVKFKKLPE